MPRKERQDSCPTSQSEICLSSVEGMSPKSKVHSLQVAVPLNHSTCIFLKIDFPAVLNAALADGDSVRWRRQSHPSWRSLCETTPHLNRPLLLICIFRNHAVCVDVAGKNNLWQFWMKLVDPRVPLSRD